MHHLLATVNRVFRTIFKKKTLDAIETLEDKERQLLEAQCERERLQQEGAQAAKRLQQYERERNRSEQEKTEARREIEESARKMKEYEENLKKLQTEFDKLTAEKQVECKLRTSEKTKISGIEESPKSERSIRDSTSVERR